MTPPPRGRWTHETLAATLVLVGGAPALAVAFFLMSRSPWDGLTRWTLGSGLVLAWLGAAVLLHDHVTRPLQTLSNLLAALRERDYSIRARATDSRSALGLARWEVNALADAMRQQRFDALEATALLRQVMDSIDVAIFAFDDTARLQLVNREGAELLLRPAEELLGRDANRLGLGAGLEGETPRLLDLHLPHRAGRWELRRGEYRHEGRPMQLVVLSDLTRALRAEEQEAWQRLIRVLSHEINNSLAPIQSLAGSLRGRLAEPELHADLGEGLAVIENRARSLSRFMQAYVGLARLPAPSLASLSLGDSVRRAAALESRVPIELRLGPEITFAADEDQLGQMLINLIRNAADAALETGGRVLVSCSGDPAWVEVRIEDEGPGIGERANLFVPFFTTKPGGSGIGLVLSRQIAVAHGGDLQLGNREESRGAIARVRLPRRG